jgi:glycosyltransferase involved in cell wall biosynthesis
LIQNKIKILYLIDKLKIGGAEKHLFSVLRYIDRNLFEPAVFCLNYKSPIGEQIEELGIEVTSLNLDKIYNLKSFLQGRYFNNELKKRKIQILHCYLNSSNIFGPFYSSFNKNGLKTIISRRDDGFGLSSKLEWVQKRIVHFYVDKVFTVSNKIRENTVENWNVVPEKVKTIYNGVQITNGEFKLNYYPLVEFHIPIDAKLIGCVGNLKKVKGQELLIRAVPEILEKHPQAYFLIIGDGAERENLKKLCFDLDVNNYVIFTGRRNDVNSFYPILDVVVNTSFTEGISNSLLEAMSFSKPVIATKVGGNPEIIEHKKTGVLLQERSISLLANEINDLLDNPKNAKNLGENATRKVKEKYSVQTMIYKMQKEYLSLLN